MLNVESWGLFASFYHLYIIVLHNNGIYAFYFLGNVLSIFIGLKFTLGEKWLDFFILLAFFLLIFFPGLLSSMQ